MYSETSAQNSLYPILDPPRGSAPAEHPWSTISNQEHR